MPFNSYPERLCRLAAITSRIPYRPTQLCSPAQRTQIGADPVF